MTNLRKFIALALAALLTIWLAVRPVFQNVPVPAIIAGGKGVGYGGDGGPAAVAGLDTPFGLCNGPDASLYIADMGNHVIRKVDRKGIIETVAGNGKTGSPREGNFAKRCSLTYPIDVAWSAKDGLYVADSGARCIYRVTDDGRIFRFAGCGQRGYSGDGGSAARAKLDDPRGIALDRLGNLYIADFAANRVRVVSLDGRIRTIAGNGGKTPSVDKVRAIDGGVVEPNSICVSPNGEVYIACSLIIYRVRRDGMMSPFAYVADSETKIHTGACVGKMSLFEGVGMDAQGRLVCTDSIGHRVLRIDQGGRIDVLTPERSFRGFYPPPRGEAKYGPIHPESMVVRQDGSIAFCDSQTSAVYSLKLSR
jgi:sugar lactone lactonase YvrE